MQYIENELILKDFTLANEIAYLPNGLEPLLITKEVESSEYGALTFVLNNHKVKFRVGKVTPTKLGHFVTLWKREDGITKPHHISDPFDFFIISVRDNEGFGQFIFHKSVLLKNNIISSDIREGKRGIRVYLPWIKTLSKQAKKTQSWQCQHFINLGCNQNIAHSHLAGFFKVN